MFDNTRLDKLTEQLAEAVSLMRAILAQNEANNKAWKILADRVLQLDDPNKAAFGTVRHG